MTTVMIDLEGGRTASMTPPQELGAAFAHVIATALAWNSQEAAAFNNYHDNVRATCRAGYDRAVELIGEALREAGLEWSCQFGEPGSDPEAFPYIDTLAQQVSPGAANVAAAVLARDLRLVARVDFGVVTGWWIAAGQPMPQYEGVWSYDPDEIERQQRKLYYTRGKVAGWPMAAVDVPEKPSHVTVPAPRPELGAGVAAVVATANGWDDQQAEYVSGHHPDPTAAPGISGFDVSDRIRCALQQAGVVWENPGYRTEGAFTVPWTAGGEVAAAVLARDLKLITEADFTAATGWWLAAGQPLPEPATSTFAADAAEVEENASKLADSRHIPGWPVAAVTN